MKLESKTLSELTAIITKRLSDAKKHKGDVAQAGINLGLFIQAVNIIEEVFKETEK